ncbi:hypothetical protein JM654_06775 [Microbacterium oxydans]|nr:hypothetical protein [Microbacterium oxydans]
MRDDSDDTARTLLSAMIEGDPDRLRRRSISLGVPVDDADDAAQNALLRAWRSISHLDTPQPGRMCAWLDVIARNVAVDLARQRSRRPRRDAGRGRRTSTSASSPSSRRESCSTEQWRLCMRSHPRFGNHCC